MAVLCTVSYIYCALRIADFACIDNAAATIAAAALRCAGAGAQVGGADCGAGGGDKGAAAAHRRTAGGGQHSSTGAAASSASGAASGLLTPEPAFTNWMCNFSAALLGTCLTKPSLSCRTSLPSAGVPWVGQRGAHPLQRSVRLLLPAPHPHGCWYRSSSNSRAR